MTTPQPFALSPRNCGLLVAAVVVLALALRVATIRDASFFADNFEDFSATKAWVEKGRIPTVGTHISGKSACMPGGGLYSLLALPYLMSKHFWGMQVMAFLLAALAALLAIRFVWAHSSPLTALYFALLLLFNPYFVVMSSGYWNPNLLLLFAVLTWGILVSIASGSESRANYFFLPPLAALMAQFHFITFFIVPPAILLFLFPYRRRPHIAWLGWGLLAAAASYLPYVMDEAAHGFPNTRAMFSTGAQIGRLAMPRIDMFLLFPTNEFSFFLGKGGAAITHFYREQGALGWAQLAVNALTLLLSLGMNLSAAALFIPRLKKRFPFLREGELLDWERAALRLSWLCLAVILAIFLALRMPGFHLHYYYVIFILSFAPFLVCFRILTVARPAVARALLCFAFLSSGAAASAMLHYYETREKPLSFPRQRELTAVMLADAAGNNFALRCNYDLAIHDRFYETMAVHFLGSPWNRDDGAPLVYQIQARRYDAHWAPLPLDPRMVPLWERDGIALYKMNLSPAAHHARP